MYIFIYDVGLETPLKYTEINVINSQHSWDRNDYICTDISGEEKKTTYHEKMMDMVLPGKRRRGRPRRRWIDNNREDEQIRTDSWHDWKQTVLEDDGKDWHTKKWRWSLKVRNVITN